MMSNDQNSDRLADNAKQKVVREAMEVDAAKVALANGERLGSLCGVQHEAPQLLVEIVRKLPTGDALVILHDRVNIGVNLPVQDEPHQRLWSRIRWSS